MTATMLESKFILLMSHLFNIRLKSFRFYAADSLLDKTLANAWVPEDNFIFLYCSDILQSGGLLVHDHISEPGTLLCVKGLLSMAISLDFVSWEHSLFHSVICNVY